jgi:indole-3-glycerol phosphate synthase
VSDVLARICAGKRDEIANAKAARNLAEIERAARAAAPPRAFVAALGASVAAGRYGLIAEIKRASPSRGLIRADFDPAALAQAYSTGGATCLSVLTDAPHFQGSPDYLVAAREACALPVLRKDFMLDPYQIVESRALGADCVLLIMAALGDADAAALESTAHGLGMDVLIEVHDRAELERALRLRSQLIGINNRNLKTLAVDLAVTEELATLLPPGRMLVSESGLYTPDDLARMARVGARCFLVGESLMKQPDVAAATRALLAPPSRAERASA